jgi:hypothetical protein
VPAEAMRRAREWLEGAPERDWPRY